MSDEEFEYFDGGDDYDEQLDGDDAMALASDDDDAVPEKKAGLSSVRDCSFKLSEDWAILKRGGRCEPIRLSFPRLVYLALGLFQASLFAPFCSNIIYLVPENFPCK